jgi:uncharacterized membrane protein YoaK (UPF0700 family)
MVLSLAIAGGGVDTIVILGFQVLTGAQTGNISMLVVALAEGRFAAGGSLRRILRNRVRCRSANRLKRKSESALGPIGSPLTAELVSLGILLVCWHFAQHPDPKLTAVLVALAASSMGMPCAAVLRLHGSPNNEPYHRHFDYVLHRPHPVAVY